MHRRRTRRRPISRRRREERQRTIRRRVMIAVGVILLAGLAMAPQLQENLVEAVHRTMGAVQAMGLSGMAQAEIALDEKTVYALQLGAYDNGSHAQDELLRLSQEGVFGIVWQREQMRIVCDAAGSREKLTPDAAQGNDVWIIREEMPEVVLRIHAETASLDAVRSLLMLPDAVFERLCIAPEELPEIVDQTLEDARKALYSHPENALYTQLAQSLVNWCNLMNSTRENEGDVIAASYARVTMCTLCYELRQALNAQNAASIASAQRTPSTAADVIPPA